MHARKMMAAVLGAALGAGLLGVLATPAEAYGIQAVHSTGWAYTDSRLPDSSFVKPAGDMPVGAWADTDGTRHKSRAYFTLDVSGFAGTVAHEANVIAGQQSATDCTIARPVELWRTDPITATTSWNNAPRQRELLGTVQAGGAAGCRGNLTWDVLSALQNLVKRGEQTLTVEIRVPQGVEGDLAYGRKVSPSALLDTMTNHRPTVTRVGLDFPSWACGTAHKPQPIGPRTYGLMADIADQDSQDFLSIQVAVTAAGHETQTADSAGSRWVDWDMSQYAHGTVVAWTARAYDQHDYSDETKPCYVIIDTQAPPAPVVSSSLYPNDGAEHGGPNVTGTFTFGSGGSKDVVGYYWGRDGETNHFIPAPKPGAAVSLEYVPASSGADALSVRTVDSADLRSEVTTYAFQVRSTAPDVQVTMGGVGMPSRLAISTRFPGVTGFGYRIGTADEITVPAVDGAADVPVVFPEAGSVVLEVRAYAGAEFLGAYKQSVQVVDSPHVESTDFGPGHDGAAGRPGTFTFRPGRPDVVAYEYRFDADWLRIDADSAGTAVLTWTPTEGDVFTSLSVRSVNADGSTSSSADYSFWVEETRPGILSDDYPDVGAFGGVGVPGEFFFGTSQPDVDAFLCRFNDEPEQVVDVDDSFGSIVFTPEHAGVNTLTVRTRFQDGSISPARTYAFDVA